METEELSLPTLTPEEINMLTRLLAKVNSFPKMEFEVLKKIWEKRFFPLSTVELVIFEKVPENTNKEGFPRILLVYRDDDYFPDCWHHPGGYIGGGESIYDAIQRVALREIKTKVKNISFVGAAHWPNMKRDHQYSSLFVSEPDSEINTQKGKLEYFNFDNLPRNLLCIHQFMHDQVRLYFKFLSGMENFDPAFKNMFFDMHKIFEDINLK